MSGWQRQNPKVREKLTVAQIAFKENVQKRTVEEGLERLANTGSILPAVPGVKEGTILQQRRKTSAVAQNNVRPTIFKNRGKKYEYTTYMMQQDVGGTMKKVHRTTANKRIHEAGFRAMKPRKKENYTPKARKQRIDWAEEYRNWTKERWRRMVFVDEHAMTVPNEKSASRQMQARKRFVWRQPIPRKKKKKKEDGEDGEDEKKGDNPYDNSLCAPKGGKNIMGGTPVRCIFAILDDEFIVVEDTQSYVKKSKPVPKPPPKLSKNGKPLGRRPKKKTQKEIKKRRYDAGAHAAFLREMHKAAEKKLGKDEVKNGLQVVHVYQDGLPLHRTAHCRKVMEELSIVDHAPPKCGYSPDSNAIEELFYSLDDRHHKRQIKRRCKTADEWMKRTKEICTALGEDGTVQKTVDEMPEHVKDMLTAKGGPTRW